MNVTTRYTEVQFENAKIWFGNVGWWFQNAKEQFWATESKWSESKNVNHNLRIQNIPSHSVKRVRIWSYSSQYFPAFGLNTERYGISLQNISPDSVRMRGNTNQNNSEYGHFSFGVWKAKSIVLMKCKIFNLNTKIKDRMRHDVNFNTEKLVSSSEISFQFPCQNAISKYKHSVLKYSLALYEGRKYLKRNPNFIGEKSVNSLSVWPPLYR